MSRVFLATETALNRSVVIKTVSTDLLEGLSVQRFAREVKVAARLQQANIVPVLAAGDANGIPYYTMPFVAGESLRARMASGRPMPVADAVRILRDVAQALAYAHGEGVVHRDIKPENVLLSGGVAVVTDFGIAKAIGLARTQDGNGRGAEHLTLTSAGSSLGTPAYMAPEQAAAEANIDGRADIYAWGVVAWELLAGRHPFAGKPSLQALIAAQMSETPAPLSSIRNDVSPALSDVVSRCLEKEPNRRPASATELLALLDAAASSGSGVVRPPATNARRRSALVGIAIVAATAVGAVTLKWRSGQRPSDAHFDRSLAVIPFAASPSDTGSAYLGEGIADEVTTELSQIPGVRLAGRSSAMRYVGKAVSAQEAGKALGVAAILNGTVRRVGDSVRVTAELSNASDGLVAWHDIYNRAAADVFALQTEIARAIAGQLQVALSDPGSVAGRGTNDAAAYERYLKGVYLYRRRHLGEAVVELNQATTRDSNFARAWATLSLALTVWPSYGTVRLSDVLPRARAAAERAVRLDPNLSDAHDALGFVHAEAFEWPEAEAEFKRAIALDPRDAEPKFRLGVALLCQARAAEAIPLFQEAVARDRLYTIATSFLGLAEVQAGRIAEGLEDERRSLAFDPNAMPTLVIMTASYAIAGIPDSARYYAHRVIDSTSNPANVGLAAYALARSGATSEAKAVTARLEGMPADTWTRWSALTLAYLGLGDSTKVIDAMEHAALGDGDEFPLTVERVAGEFPSGPRVDAVLRRFRLDPGLYTKAGAKRRSPGNVGK